jgi:hypothetical protein
VNGNTDGSTGGRVYGPCELHGKTQTIVSAYLSAVLWHPGLPASTLEPVHIHQLDCPIRLESLMTVCPLIGQVSGGSFREPKQMESDAQSRIAKKDMSTNKRVRQACCD